MRRYWIEKKFFKENKKILIEGESFHHIFDVCRQEVGSRFEVLSEGKAYFSQVLEVGKKSALVGILEERVIKEIPKPWIHLCLSVSKFQTMDTIIEKSVELGVHSFHPFVSEFSFIRDLKNPRFKDKNTRWERIIKSATQQSDRGHLMEIYPIDRLENIVEKMNQKESSVGLFPYEGGSEQTIQEALRDIKGKSPQDIWLFIGSEGGYSDKEVDFFRKSGLKSSSFGDQVLRVETACLALISVVKYELNPLS